MLTCLSPFLKPSVKSSIDFSRRGYRSLGRIFFKQFFYSIGITNISLKVWQKMKIRCERHGERETERRETAKSDWARQNNKDNHALPKVTVRHGASRAERMKLNVRVKISFLTVVAKQDMASNAMTRMQTIFFALPDTALSPLAIHFEFVQTSVFCYMFAIVDRSKANTWKCLRGKHLASSTLKTWRDLAITSAALATGRLFDARLVRPPLQAHTKAVELAKKGQVNNVLPSCKLNETTMLRLQTVVQNALFPKKKNAPGGRSCQNLRKDVKVDVFWHHPCRTHACGDLLLPPSNMFLPQP